MLEITPNFFLQILTPTKYILLTIYQFFETVLYVWPLLFSEIPNSYQLFGNVVFTIFNDRHFLITLSKNTFGISAMSLEFQNN